MTKMKATDYVALYLSKQGVTHCFELIGGTITHLINSITKKTNIKIISCHHEQSAGFAAEGYARISGKTGVALATSGPGATNLITAIGSCYFDSSPTVFITGQVNTYEISKGKKMRQLGFQETDIVSIVKPITKFSIQIRNVDDLPRFLEKAFHEASTGRQGPCLIDLPLNIQNQFIKESLSTKYLNPFKQVLRGKDKYEKHLTSQISNLLSDIGSCNAPLLLLGGGCSTYKNRNSSKLIAEKLGIPIVLSLMGLDIIPYNDPLRVGFIGSYGNRWANKILRDADLLLVVGSRLDIRQTGSNIKSFCHQKIIWQVDISPSNVCIDIDPAKHIISEIKDFADIISLIKEKNKGSRFENKYETLWPSKINSIRNKYPAILEYKSSYEKEINPISLLQRISEESRNKKTIFITDVGQHQMWSAQALTFNKEDRFITSGGMGSMGFGLPASIGASFGGDYNQVILISGDGSFQVNIQELQTIVRNKLNIKFVIINNNCHGMVRQFQESYFKGDCQSSLKGYSAPSFVKVARAYGIKSIKIKYEFEINKSVKELIESENSLLLEVLISKSSKLYPKLSFGRPFGEMEPETTPNSTFINN